MPFYGPIIIFFYLNLIMKNNRKKGKEEKNDG